MRLVENTLTPTNLLGRLTAQEAKLVHLEAENARLQAEDAELRRRLGLNSSNSHKPLSSDRDWKKRVQPTLPREKRRSKPASATARF